MPDAEISARMRDDWNARAREDAGYYVAFGRRDQDDAGFFATATEIVNSLETELRRFPASERGALSALEIGCGPGRLMRPLARHFAEIHGVDVSDEMVALARKNLADIPHAEVHATDGARLTQFRDASFDFIYSYAVFQHVPAREVVLEYLAEIHRVLKPGGIARLQFNGLPSAGSEAAYDTWAGARFSSADILEFTRLRDLQVLALEGAATQYMWTTWRKRSPGWFASMESRDAAATRSDPQAPAIERVTNAQSFEPVAPSRGRFASISLWVKNLPDDAGLHHLRVTIGDSLGTVTYIGPLDREGKRQISVVLPELESTGLLTVELRWLDHPIAARSTLRVIPPPPVIPSLCSVTDGINLVAGKRIETGIVKMTLEDIAHPDEIQASLGGLPVAGLEFFCVDPRPQKFEVNFRLPEGLEPGSHELQVRVGRRKLPTVTLEVVNVQASRS